MGYCREDNIDILHMPNVHKLSKMLSGNTTHLRSLWVLLLWEGTILIVGRAKPRHSTSCLEARTVTGGLKLPPVPWDEGWRGCRSWKTLDLTLNEDLFLRPSCDTTSRYFQRPNLTLLGMCEYFWTLVGQWLVSSTHMGKNARKTSLGTILFLWLKITYIQNQHQI